MSLGWQPGAPLSRQREGGAAFAAWLAPATGGGAGVAGQEAREALARPVPDRGAPLFVGNAADAVDGLDPALGAELAAGRLDVVVTGQQPGFLGGPLLTLHKTATAIALAAERTAAGQPSVAVFWCADDDDDLVEALGPVGWDGDAATLVRAEGRAAARHGQVERAMIGPTPARRWCAPGAALLQRLAARDGAGVLTGDLAALWQTALSDDWNWSRLNVAALRRVFAAHPMLVVRGNNPSLQAAAAPFYAAVGGRRARLRALAQNAGRRLAGPDGAAPISERSLARDLFAAAQGRRVFLPDDVPMPAAATLRPGVLLRSLAQDWLLRPAAVVVGPGEAAYLEQLRPLYGELEIRRSPLVPRLFAWILPPRFPADRVASFADGPRLDAAAADALAGKLAGEAAGSLAGALAGILGIPADRAHALAEGRARRWRRGVGAMLRAESERHWAGANADVPAWILPEGRRQERRLAAVAAAAMFGDELPGALVAAARAHLRAGADGRWHEYLVG